MTKLSELETKKQIVKACLEMDEDPCVFLAYASIETGGTFNNLAKSSNGKYVGVFQLGDGVGGVTGNNRYNPYLSCIGAIKYMRSNKKQIVSSIGSQNWKPYMMYLAHQQGAGGFSVSYKEQNKLISEAKYSGNIRSNAPKNAKYVYDFIKYWENKFNVLISSCDVKCNTNISGLAESTGNDGSLDVNYDNNGNNNQIVVGNCVVTWGNGKGNNATNKTKLHRNYFVVA